MKKSGKGCNNTNYKVDLKEEQSESLPSNNVNARCSDLGYLDTSSDNVSEDMILDYLARIIADIYLDQYHGNTKNKEGCNILSGINERTS